MKTSKNIVANIKEMGFNDNSVRAFAVTFIETTEKTIFGRTWTKTEEQGIPFIFKTLEIAKDFCELKPTIVSDVFVNSNDAVFDNRHLVKYYTYRLVDKNTDRIIGYVKWDKSVTVKTQSVGNEIFSVNLKSPLVDKFVTDINLKRWVETHSLYDVGFKNEHEKLSELLAYPSKNGMPVYNEWNFKLVEQ